MRFCLLLAALLALAGCPAETRDQTYAGSARDSYTQGMEAFEDEDYLEAVKHFTQVKNKYAYSKFAALAELRIADSYFQQEKYIEAVDAYRTFMQGRPNHRDVPYAMWRIALSHYEQIPGDFFLFPPNHEKDQASTKEALRALEAYVQRFPEDEHIAEARERIQECRRLMARAEMYVAGFYLNDARPQSARGRLETVVRDYGDLADVWSDAALKLAQVYVALDMPNEARATAERLVKAHPNRSEAEQARDLMATQPRVAP